MKIKILRPKKQKQKFTKKKLIKKKNKSYLKGKSMHGPPKLGYKLSGEFKFKPNAVRSCPIANDTKLGSDSAARINVSKPTIPN